MLNPDPTKQEQARRYARLRRRLWLARVVESGLYALAWLLFGWGTSLREWLIANHPSLANPWLLVAAFTLIFGGMYYFLDLPLGYYSEFVLPHRFGQSTQTLRGWVADQVKALAIGAPLGLLLLEGVYFALRAASTLWWLWTAVGLLLFNVLLAHLGPVVILPLFNRFVPLDEEQRELADRLQGLAQRAHTRVQGIFKFDMSRRTKAANAALVGLGHTRRVVLGDTLLNEFTPAEVEVVLAHELGHHVHRDLAWHIGFGSLTTLVGLYAAAQAMNGVVQAFGFRGVADVAALPALGLILGACGLLLMPLENAFSRWRERLADEYALRLSGNREAFASAFVHLADQNLGEVEPEKWVVWLFYSHPPLGERIKMARQDGS